MDADLLRIILIVLGVLVIAGVYWWERYGRAGSAEPDDDEPLLDDDLDPEDGQEPRLDAWDDDGMPAAGVLGDGFAAADAGQSAGTATSQTSDEASPGGPMLVTLHVVSRGEHFDGADIVHVAGRCGLEPGEMDIFQCVLGEGVERQVLFSMANMVKPGTFPFGAMAEFSSPGLVLFAELDGSPDDPGRMEELLGTAHTLANELGGDLRDGQHRRLSGMKEDDLRAQVMALVEARLAAGD